jgi:hypothetical protein
VCWRFPDSDARTRAATSSSKGRRTGMTVVCGGGVVMAVMSGVRSAAAFCWCGTAERLGPPVGFAVRPAREKREPRPVRQCACPRPPTGNCAVPAAALARARMGAVGRAVRVSRGRDAHVRAKWRPPAADWKAGACQTRQPPPRGLRPRGLVEGIERDQAVRLLSLRAGLPPASEFGPQAQWANCGQIPLVSMQRTSRLLSVPSVSGMVQLRYHAV